MLAHPVSLTAASVTGDEKQTCVLVPIMGSWVSGWDQSDPNPPCELLVFRGQPIAVSALHRTDALLLKIVLSNKK